MPIQGVTFRPPAPYPLPEDFANHLRAQPEVELLRLVTQLVAENHCADLTYIERLERDGHLRVAAAEGVGPGPEAVAKDLLAHSGDNAYVIQGDAVTTSGQVVQGGQPMLFMGEVTPDEPAIPYAALRRYLLAGADKANLGFFYANPIVDANGKCHGVLTISRALASGSLNHDQPALVHAMVQLLGEALASAPVI